MAINLLSERTDTGFANRLLRVIGRVLPSERPLNPKNRLTTFPVIVDTSSLTSSDAEYVIDPVEKTAPPPSGS